MGGRSGEGPGQLDGWSNDYMDYTGLAYYGGYFFAARANNSDTLHNNPDSTNHMDIYVAKVRY